jgi:hypothetical protein
VVCTECVVWYGRAAALSTTLVLVSLETFQRWQDGFFIMAAVL